MLTIDGSQGEGGGQVLRTSLGLSALTGQAFRIGRVRARRQKPGLMHQHLAAVEAAAAICGAAVEGAALGSLELTFRPGPVRPGAYHFAIETAGSATLVLETVLPALLTAGGPSQLTLEGGTHNPLAPPYPFLEKSFLPLLAQAGARVELQLEAYGFYPAGGGRLRVGIEPVPRLQALVLLERGEVRRKRAVAQVANLPLAIAERELRVLRGRLELAPGDLAVEQVPSRGPGNVAWVELETDSHVEVFTAFGQRGLRAETLAETLAAEVLRHLVHGAPVGEHLADQLVIPLALAGRGLFRTGPPSGHLLTNVEVVRRFLDADLRCTAVEGDIWEVRA